MEGACICGRTAARRPIRSASACSSPRSPDQLGSGFGTTSWRERRRAGHAWHDLARRAGALHSQKANQPQKTNRPAAGEWQAVPRTCRTRTWKNFFECIRSGKEPTARSTLAIASRGVPHGCRQLPPWARVALGCGSGRNRLRSTETSRDQQEAVRRVFNEFGFSDDQRQLRKTIREFTEAEIRPARHGMGRDAALPRGRLPHLGSSGR